MIVALGEERKTVTGTGIEIGTERTAGALTDDHVDLAVVTVRDAEIVTRGINRERERGIVVLALQRSGDRRRGGGRRGVIDPAPPPPHPPLHLRATLTFPIRSEILI